MLELICANWSNLLIILAYLDKKFKKWSVCPLEVLEGGSNQCAEDTNEVVNFSALDEKWLSIKVF